MEPTLVNLEDVKTIGGGIDNDWHSVRVRQLHDVKNVCRVGVCFMDPDEETVVFSLEHDDDFKTSHYFGPVNEFYYILEGKFTVWWGKDGSNLNNFLELKRGDCTHYTPGWKYKVKNTGTLPGRFFYVMMAPGGIEKRVKGKT